MFQRTTAINKILALKERKKVIQGGTSAGKTYAIIPILIDRAIKNDGIKITVVAETIPAVKDGAVDIFKQVMQDTFRWEDSQWLGSPMQYTFKNGSRIQFKAFDTKGKAKASGKRDILFLNEANHIPFGIADELIIRSKETFIDFNPNNTFWVHDEVLKEPNSEFLLLTYLDNEACPKETIEDLLIKKGKAYYDINGDLKDTNNIKNDYWANWWRVYGLGEIGSLDGVVFNNWEIIDNIPKEAELIGYGQDFGYTNDPTTLVALYRYNGKFIFDELIYKTNMLNSMIANELRELNIKGTIYADSAEPKSITEIKRYGFDIRPCKKGADSINFGVSLLQENDLLITSNSHNLIEELRSYIWATDRDGKSLNKPIDNYNHCIDAMRYVAIEKMKKKTKSRYYS